MEKHVGSPLFGGGAESRGEPGAWRGAGLLLAWWCQPGDHEPSHLLSQVEMNSFLPLLSRTADVRVHGIKGKQGRADRREQKSGGGAQAFLSPELLCLAAWPGCCVGRRGAGI